MTRVAISQPMYFPWAGFIAQMSMADVYIWLDDAQHSKGSFTNRIQVKVPEGRRWMSIPLVGKGTFKQIADLEAVGSGWSASHRALLSQSLDGQPCSRAALAIFDDVLSSGGDLCGMLIAGAEAQARHLGVLPARILRSSQMNVDGTSWMRVLRLVQAVGGTEYLTGHGAIGYLDHDAFNAAGLRVSYMDYRPMPWPQKHGAFTPYVTGLDLIAALPAEVARNHLQPASMDWREFKFRKEEENARSK